MDDISAALQPYGYEWLVSMTGIPGPGGLVVVFATLGDFCTASLTHDNKVLWVMSCGGTEDGYTEEAKELHDASKRLHGSA